MPTAAKIEARPNLRTMSDARLVQLQMHPNDWHVRQARSLLQYRAASGKLDSSLVHSKLNDIFASAPNTPEKLRALWALQVTGGLSRDRLGELLTHDSEHVRGWAIQFLCDPSMINAFQPERNAGWKLEARILRRFAVMARVDPSHELITATRLAKAERLLRETNLTMDRIANHCGLEYAECLSVLFRKHRNMTPGEYRQQHRQKL